MKIKIKRVYDPWDESDGYRILIDRLWPRGLKKESLKLDEWAKNLAPSTELRKWFNHQPELFDEFAQKYHVELQQHEKDLDRVVKIAKTQSVTLLYAASDPNFNQAVALLGILNSPFHKSEK
ncbi:MAG TPA: DUF488 domain-containing protein [Sphingobacteriaceae bacterium]|nr:DUF488 domain-containing protein [Sphingobacteriaceae bacterium]